MQNMAAAGDHLVLDVLSIPGTGSVGIHGTSAMQSFPIGPPISASPSSDPQLSADSNIYSYIGFQKGSNINNNKGAIVHANAEELGKNLAECSRNLPCFPTLESKSGNVTNAAMNNDDIEAQILVSAREAEAATTSSSSGADAGIFECRICHDENDQENLEAPCACSGSLKYAHRQCVQRWCNEKGDTICEICKQTYKNGYEVPDRPVALDSSPIELTYSLSNGHWGINEAAMQDPRVMSLLQAEYDEYTAANASGAACLRFAAVALLTLFLLHHALEIAAPNLDEDLATFFTVVLLKAVGFILPCYLMARALHLLVRRRIRRQREEASMVATEVSILLQVARTRRQELTQARRLHLTISPHSIESV